MSHFPDEVLVELHRGNFGVQWNENTHFSYVDEDRSTEWVNGIEKRARGISRITQTPSALFR